MDYQLKISNALGKIKSIIFDLSRDLRIKNDELVDFNDAMAAAWDAKKAYDEAIEALKNETSITSRAIDDAAIREKKLNILLEILGMHKRGIDRWLDYPIRFVIIINSQLRKANQPIYHELYFEDIEMKWRWLNRMIDRDIHNIELIAKIKEVYASHGPAIKEKSAELLRTIHEETGYLEPEIRAGKPKNELTRKIIDHWYNELSTNYAS
jgi:hypothetical protein